MSSSLTDDKSSIKNSYKFLKKIHTYIVGKNLERVCLVFLELLCWKSSIGENAPKDRTTNGGGCGIVADPKTWNVLRRYLAAGCICAIWGQPNYQQ